MTIGLIPAGYYDGVDRRLSNGGVVTIQGIQCPYVGRISMNMCVVDISKASQARVAMPVTIYSSEAGEPNSIQNSAVIAGTIPYELLVNIAESVRRTVI